MLATLGRGVRSLQEHGPLRTYVTVPDRDSTRESFPVMSDTVASVRESLD